MGLYDDDLAAVNGGDQNDKDYWQSKAMSIALDEALKTRQPESRIKLLIEKAIPHHGNALKKFPNHADVKAWKEKAEGVLKKIDVKAPSAPWKAGFPWGLGNEKSDKFFQGWVAMHWARCARDAGDWQTAFDQSLHAADRLGPFGCKNEAAKWPEDYQKLVNDGEPEMRELRKQAQAKR